MKGKTMRLLSFLSDIEKAVIAESPAVDGGAWTAARMVNFHHGLARLTLTPCAGNDLCGGNISLQSYSLADGSVCLKAALNWDGSTASPTVSIFSTPKLNWKLEASRIGSLWLEGPREVAATPAKDEQLQTSTAAVA